MNSCEPIVYNLHTEQYTTYFTVESKFPVFTGKIDHAHTVCTKPFSQRREENEANGEQHLRIILVIMGSIC